MLHVLVITKGYRVRVTTIKGQNIFTPAMCFEYAYVTDDQHYA